MKTDNPLTRFLGTQAALILDGGLATTLEAEGFDLDDGLWSARLLLDDPAAIRNVHTMFLAAGADCVTTASCQASLPGFAACGLDERMAADLLRLSCRLAIAARDAFWSAAAHRAGRQRPLVAAGIGPYGAFLADGSEYTGRYDLDAAGLRAFHEPRWRILADCGTDLLACETIPSRTEAEVLLSLLAATPAAWAWLSFSCADARHLRDGTPLRAAVAACDAVPQVAAGAYGVGGCCRVGPAQIAEIRAWLRG